MYWMLTFAMKIGTRLAVELMWAKVHQLVISGTVRFLKDFSVSRAQFNKLYSGGEIDLVLGFRIFAKEIISNIK
jgi:hypothetical protein